MTFRVSLSCIVSLCALILCWGLFSQAFALEQISESNYHEQSKIFTHHFTDSNGMEADVVLRCEGTGTGTDGGWVVQSVQGYCATGVTAVQDNVELTINPCLVSQAPANKNYCVSGTGISGVTGDDMFKIEPGAKGFFDYRHIGVNEEDRIIRIERKDDGNDLYPNKDIMMPSGPPTGPGKYGDYKKFVDNAPGFIEIKPGCHPFTIKFCENFVPPSPACGTADGANYGDAPADDLCNVGVATTVSSNATDWLWECTGAPGTTKAGCSANKVINGACGSANGQNSVTAPAANLRCASGAVTGFAYTGDPYTGDGWTWSCTGTNGGSPSPSCVTNRSVRGICGTANGKNYASAPTAALRCSRGAVTGFSNTATGWTWSCAGLYGGDPRSCGANKSVNGTCGPANNKSYDNAPAAALRCGVGSHVSFSTTSTGWRWKCSGTSGGGNSSWCTADKNITCVKPSMDMVWVQDLTGSFRDDMNNMSIAFDDMRSDSTLNNWKIGMTSFQDFTENPRFPEQEGAPEPFAYKKNRNLTSIASSAVLSTVNGPWTTDVNNTGGGSVTIGAQTADGKGASAESSSYALDKAIDEFYNSSYTSEKPLIIVVSTDATTYWKDTPIQLYPFEFVGSNSFYNGYTPSSFFGGLVFPPWRGGPVVSGYPQTVPGNLYKIETSRAAKFSFRAVSGTTDCYATISGVCLQWGKWNPATTPNRYGLTSIEGIHPDRTALANKIKNKNIRLIFLVGQPNSTHYSLNQVKSFYSSFITTAGGKGTVVSLSNNSSALLSDLKTGLGGLVCD